MSNKPLQAADMNKEQLLEAIRNWQTTDELLGDVVHRYFEKTELRHWCDVAEEGRRIFAELFEVEVEESSPIDDLLSGVAAQASDGMCISMAAALGWDAHVLMLVLSRWNEADENGKYEKKTVTLEELKALYEEALMNRGEPRADY